jgi:hypothetical protein
MQLFFKESVESQLTVSEWHVGSIFRVEE